MAFLLRVGARFIVLQLSLPWLEVVLPVFVDSHCHFDAAVFAADRAAVLHKCNTQGIAQLIIPGVTPAQWPLLAQLSQQYPGLYYALGVHPWWLAELQLGAAVAQHALREQLSASLTAAGDKCVALGEAGLDATINTPLSVQQELLLLHIELANQFHKPLIIHSVKTHNEILACFKQQPPRYGGVIHAFSGSLDTAQQFIARGFLLGVGGTITYERAQKTRATFSKVPLQYLLLETDAPDMPLCGKQGERNSPEYLPLIAQALAQLQGVSIEQVARITTQNACQLFSLPYNRAFLDEPLP